MKQKIVWLTSGLPGAGKSTWIQEKIAENGGVWCSRDTVRFSMVKENEPYFSRETEVFNAWIAQIKEALNDPEVENIYVDATHLNDKSRMKTLNKLPKENIQEVINVVFLIPIETCIQRNNKRFGRSLVPEEVIRNMEKTFELPLKDKTLYVTEIGSEYYG